MQNIISFVNEQLSWEESPRRHDWHDPPHADHGASEDDRSPPHRLASVARSDFWETFATQMSFPGKRFGRRRLFPVVSLDLEANTSGEVWLHPDSLHLDAFSNEGLAVGRICCNVGSNNSTIGNLLMVTPARTLDQLNKVVVGFLHGARIKGYLHGFSARNESFSLLPEEDPLGGQEIKVEMKALKAVFFVWDFTGNHEHQDPYQDSPPTGVPKDGRTIEVTFRDGEKIVGRTEAYNSQRIGFFISPVDPKSNNIRIFVVNKNTRQVRLL
jgi:hypothetical protein